MDGISDAQFASNFVHNLVRTTYSTMWLLFFAYCVSSWALFQVKLVEIPPPNSTEQIQHTQNKRKIMSTSPFAGLRSIMYLMIMWKNHNAQRGHYNNNGIMETTENICWLQVCVRMFVCLHMWVEWMFQYKWRELGWDEAICGWERENGLYICQCGQHHQHISDARNKQHPTTWLSWIVNSERKARRHWNIPTV